MDLNVISDDTKVRKIEDIIELQKASGKINARQVLFQIPNDSEGVSDNLTRSLDNGLSKIKSELRKHAKKSQRKISACRTLLPDAVSWPSDSDITVLRMKLCLNNNLKDNVTIPGDGLHQPNSSSMINLATLMLQSPQPSKHSIFEEMLFPLSSWEGSELETKIETKEKSPKYSHNKAVLHAACSQYNNKAFSKASDCTDLDAKSKVARFFRLYFCPCCSCLYNMEKMREEPSAYFTNKKL
ncbi:uncharacterized protein LOC123706361 [Colias croceus]|uniref:uncharacterized protein LOC123706361 n=1 Tax=Colias crocea TaxID=72248 RepID=UPI001E280052|nr:uncharacterized protein LOC123706361 [Colias croceus]